MKQTSRQAVSQNRAVFLILLLFATQADGMAASRPMELRWSELAPLIQGRRVQLTLVKGGKLDGQAVVVREDSLAMDIHGKGSETIPRESVAFIKVRGTRGSWGRSLGTVLGVISGVVVGTYVAVTGTSSAGAGIPLFLAVAGGITFGGYYAGREIDRHDMLIRIVP